MQTQKLILGGALFAALAGATSCAVAGPPKPEDIAKVTAALPEKAPATPAAPRKVLVYTRSTGFRHSSIELGAEAFRLMGEKTGAYAATVSDDPMMFEAETLKQFDAVLFVNTTSEPLKPKADDPLAAEHAKTWKQNLLDFVNSGKGFAGVHAATDAYHGGGQSWPEFQKMIGGSFDGHPWHEKVTLSNQDTTHPVNACFEGKDFEVTDEIYQMQNYKRDNLRVLTGLNVLKTNMNKGGVKRQDGDFAVSWVRNQEKGRVFYSSLGHREEIYWNPVVLKHYLAGLQFALGDLKADATSLPLSDASRAAWRQYLETPIAANDGRDGLHGVYAGTFAPAKDAAGKPVEAKVVAWGRDEWRAVVELPDGEKTKRVEVPIKKAGNALNVGGNAGGADWTGKLENGKLTLSGGGEFDLTRAEKQSSTAGLKPPADAVVLLAYEEGKPPSLDAWANKNWRRVNDGSMQVNGGDQRTVREFGDIRLHLEYKPPLTPEARDQGRGNSGVYLMDRYEVQVLDSFGWPPADNQSGGIYKVAVPKVNAALPPTEWQTYDFSFRAPRFAANGDVRTPATVTAYLNGVLIHDNVKIPGPTGGGAKDNVAKAALRLQDHSNPVRFRNIWVVEQNFPEELPLPSPLPAK